MYASTLVISSPCEMQKVILGVYKLFMSGIVCLSRTFGFIVKPLTFKNNY